MKILILDGSPRRNGNTAFLVNAFREGAESKGHSVEIANVGTMKINPCMACDYCHNKGEGKCIQQDDMQALYPKFADADMVVLASPVHYFAFSGQLQNCITRWYAPNKPAAKKYAMILSSACEDVYDGPIAQYRGCLDYFEAQSCGIKVFYGDNQKTEENAELMRNFGAAL